MRSRLDHLAKAWRRNRRSQSRQNSVKNLKSVVLRSRRENLATLALRIDGQMTYNKQSWMVEAQAFGQRRFGDSGNDAGAQLRRLQQLWEGCRSSRTASDRVSVEPWDVIEARSRLGSGSAGPDGVPPQVWRALPFVFVMQILNLFQNYACFDSNISTSHFWRQLEFVGIPKDKRTAELLPELRWIGLMPVLQTWYLRSLRTGLRSSIQKSPVHTYGFQPQRVCSDI